MLSLCCLVTPEVVAEHDGLLSKQLMPLYFNQTELRTMTVGSGQMEFSQEFLYSANTPRRVIITQVKGSSFAGTYNSNPFEFLPFNIK